MLQDGGTEQVDELKRQVQAMAELVEDTLMELRKSTVTSFFLIVVDAQENLMEKVDCAQAHADVGERRASLLAQENLKLRAQLANGLKQVPASFEWYPTKLC